MTGVDQQETEAVERYKGALAAGLSDYEAREEGWPSIGYRDTPVTLDHLRGPWQAVISSRAVAYPDLATVRIELGDDAEFDISVRRGSALPDDDGYLPFSYRSGDVAYEICDVWMDGDGDPSVSAQARWAQAQAMAAGLNVGGGTPA